MEITASEALKIFEMARNPDPWDRLFERIRKEVEKGRLSLAFDEEREGVKFKERRGEVVKKLEKLGFQVDCHRVQNSDFAYEHGYHNEYYIGWDLVKTKIFKF